MISTSIIFSTGEKKWMPMKLPGSCEVFGERGDRQRRGVGGEDRVGASAAAAALAIGLRLDLAILEHGLDDEVAVLRARRSRRSRVMRASSASRSPALARPFAIRSSITSLCDGALPLSALSWSRSISTTSMPACARDIGDAGAHEAGADDADLLELGRRHVRADGARPCSVPASRGTASGSSPPLPCVRRILAK